jgi:hypothetical protein
MPSLKQIASTALLGLTKASVDLFFVDPINSSLNQIRQNNNNFFGN